MHVWSGPRSARLRFRHSLVCTVCRRNRSRPVVLSLRFSRKEVCMFTTSSLTTANRKILLAFVLLLTCGVLNCAKKKSDSESIVRSTRPIAAHTLRGLLKQTLTGHDGSVRSVAFSVDGKTLASAGLGNVV